jgi:uncharacterized membrane protein
MKNKLAILAAILGFTVATVVFAQDAMQAETTNTEMTEETNETANTEINETANTETPEAPAASGAPAAY